MRAMTTKLRIDVNIAEAGATSRGSAYPVIVEPGLCDRLAEHVPERLRGRACMVVADANVAGTHAARVAASLRQAGHHVTETTFIATEADKVLDGVAAIYTEALDARNVPESFWKVLIRAWNVLLGARNLLRAARNNPEMARRNLPGARMVPESSGLAGSLHPEAMRVEFCAWKLQWEGKKLAFCGVGKASSPQGDLWSGKPQIRHWATHRNAPCRFLEHYPFSHARRLVPCARAR